MSDQQAKMRLARDALALVRQLRDGYPDPERAREAEALVEHAVMMLCDVGDPDIVRGAYRTLFGGRPDDGDGIKLRQVAAALASAVRLAGHLGLDVASEQIACPMLVQIDEAFAAVAGETLRAAVEGVAGGKVKMTGAVADLLLAARALGTRPTQARSAVQQRVTSALKPR